MSPIWVEQVLTSYFLAAEGGRARGFVGTIVALTSENPTIVIIAVISLISGIFCACCKMAMADSDSEIELQSVSSRVKSEDAVQEI